MRCEAANVGRELGELRLIELAGRRTVSDKYFTSTILGKRMDEHLRLAVCYWHTFVWPGAEVFGQGTFQRPWQETGDALARAKQKADAAFGFFSRLSTPFYTFHDTDVAPEGHGLSEYVRNLSVMVEVLAAKQAETGVKLLWGTANLFSHPRYAAGAAASPQPKVFAYAATPAFHAPRLQGRALDRAQAARANHQYDYDTATVHGFLKDFGLEREVCVNLEANHATLAGARGHLGSSSFKVVAAPLPAGVRRAVPTQILSGGFTLQALAEEAVRRDLRPVHLPGCQEYLENVVNRVIFR